MHNRIMAVLFASVLVTCIVGLREPYNATAQRNSLLSMVSQTQARILLSDPEVRPPIKITAVKVKRGEVEADKEFLDDDEWLRGLILNLTNQSGKTVLFVHILITFYRTEDQAPGLPAGWPLKVGIDPFRPEVPGQIPMEPVAPGDDMKVALSEIAYNEIKGFLKDVQFPDTIKKVQLEVVRIGFDDHTAWDVGHMYRRDPKGNEGLSPIKGWTPVREAEKEPPQVEQPTGSTRNRTAFFIRAGIRDRDLETS